MSFVSHTNIFRLLFVPCTHSVKFLGTPQRQISRPTVFRVLDSHLFNGNYRYISAQQNRFLRQVWRHLEALI
jgi:hypothetical protein